MQQLRKVNAEYHSQTTCGAQRALQSGGGRIGEIRRDQGHQESKTKRINDWDAPGLTEIRKPVGV